MRFLITYAGYEYNDNGADYYPDAFEEFDGSAEELRAYLMKTEARHQIHLALWRENRPSYHGGRMPIPDPLTVREWEKVGFDSVNDTTWLRAVVEVREVPDIDVAAVLSACKVQGTLDAQARVAKARAEVAEEDRLAAINKEATEHIEFLRLSEKFGGRA